MKTHYSDNQLKEGRDAWLYMAQYKANHGTIPPNWEEFLDLPLEVKDPATEDVQIILIRNLTAEDIRRWADNYALEVSVKYLAETLEGK